ncbi:MAG: HEPN domain-containing protein [Candidatus Methanoperedens sp.]|nr:HEPN domain-containing protein [Candidatus Methanoperedens sp.]MCZ7369857.1 HEPN domain-containing protein [Candidatus Methanoperedens sp.]
MEPLERAELLLAKSKDDETLLEEIISNEKVRDEIIGFHAQQAAEKLLKALLMAKNIPYRRTHDLRELIDLIRDNGIKFPESLMEIRTLSPFAVEFRYDYIPMEEEEPFNRQKALELVQQLRKWIKDTLLEL